MYFFEIYRQYSEGTKNVSSALRCTIAAASKCRYYLPVNRARLSGRPLCVNHLSPKNRFSFLIHTELHSTYMYVRANTHKHTYIIHTHAYLIILFFEFSVCTLFLQFLLLFCNAKIKINSKKYIHICTYAYICVCVYMCVCCVGGGVGGCMKTSFVYDTYNTIFLLQKRRSNTKCSEPTLLVLGLL
jgi:hypothetical protein